MFIFSRLVFWLTRSCQLKNVANALLSRCSFTIWPGRSLVVWNAEEQVIIACYWLYLFILSFHGPSLVLFVIKEMAANEGGSWVWLLRVCWLGFGEWFCLQMSSVQVLVKPTSAEGNVLQQFFYILTDVIFYQISYSAVWGHDPNLVLGLKEYDM